MTYSEWLTRFPQFVAIDESTYNELELEATTEMGSESKWLNFYEIALGYLISHLAAIAEKYESGDHSPVQPYREKEVDGVRVEHAISRDMQNNFDPYLATSYGQQYIKWRRIALAGPRVATY